MVDYEQAVVAWISTIMKLDVRQMIVDGVLTQKEVIDVYELRYQEVYGQVEYGGT